MDLTEGSETSAKLNLTPGKCPKENIQDAILILITEKWAVGQEFGTGWVTLYISSGKPQRTTVLRVSPQPISNQTDGQIYKTLPLTRFSRNSKISRKEFLHRMSGNFDKLFPR
jgi:hypothetical protein